MFIVGGGGSEEVGDCIRVGSAIEDGSAVNSPARPEADGLLQWG